jgi:hypothetical protein
MANAMIWIRIRSGFKMKKIDSSCPDFLPFSLLLDSEPKGIRIRNGLLYAK